MEITTLCDLIMQWTSHHFVTFCRLEGSHYVQLMLQVGRWGAVHKDTNTRIWGSLETIVRSACYSHHHYSLQF